MDYFSIKQNFYTGNYKQVLQDISNEHDLSNNTAVYYKCRSQLALNKYKHSGAKNGLDAVFNAYHQCLKSKNSECIMNLASNTTELYAINLLVCSQAVTGNLAKAWETCVKHLDIASGAGAPELLLTAVQIGLAAAQYGQVVAIFEAYSTTHEISNEDELIINLAESYIHFIRSENVSGSSFYLYEELCHTYPSWKTQLGLLNLQLQKLNLPEASTIFETLESDSYAAMVESSVFKADFVANKITYAVMNGESSDKLREQLHEIDSNHPLIKAHVENEAKFDAIVAKYSV